MAYESIFSVGLMLLLLYTTAKASLDVIAEVHMVDAMEDSGSEPPRNSIEDVNLSRLAQHPACPSFHTTVRFNGLFTTRDGFTEACLEISVHPRRPSV
ncbi:hypothetical protein FRB95_007542 [Tulasnella sp. JGI-2019a]|nr:hypothetical protein FRB95_007542 [Tulasnella sp. JGI-2019a]